MPQNQISQNQSTFDLLVKPSSQQILVVKITNITNQAQTFNTAVTSAKTNINGDAEYVPSNNKLDKSAPFDMSKIARLPKILEIPANSTKQLTIKLDIPDKGWDAVVAGGLSVIQSKAIDIKTEKNLV
ncbi:DUF916 domain-containing protein [Leuconostoc pseudomesenteroides]|uniref:DUF916 domain-containing protein n=1 Tax=Leuconostoc pseudomesenteroides TaxID=33968 RepID=UPI0021AA39AC|nr:DUF916 domain-containing protein [Leuconostoc pseudomesenteroides]